MLTKAKLSNVDDSGKPGSDVFYVQFNPNEILISEAVASTTLFYNTYTSISQSSYEDIRSYIRKLYPYTNVGVETKEQLKKICFTWSSICVIGILEKIDVRYTMFSPSGIPVRGEVSISIAGEYYGEQLQTVNPSEQSELCVHTSFLDALRDYKDSENWKNLAQQNDVKKARL